MHHLRHRGTPPCGRGLYRSHHVNWAATPAQFNAPARHLLPDKGAGAPAHTYAPALHTQPLPTHSLRRPNRTSQRPPLAALATSAAPESPVAVVINAVMLAGQTAHQLMLLLATQRGVLGGRGEAIRRILHA